MAFYTDLPKDSLVFYHIKVVLKSRFPKMPNQNSPKFTKIHFNQNLCPEIPVPEFPQINFHHFFFIFRVNSAAITAAQDTMLRIQRRLLLLSPVEGAPLDEASLTVKDRDTLPSLNSTVRV